MIVGGGDEERKNLKMYWDRKSCGGEETEDRSEIGVRVQLLSGE